MFDIISAAVKTPVSVAYKLVLVEFSNIWLVCFSKLK